MPQYVGDLCPKQCRQLDVFFSSCLHEPERNQGLTVLPKDIEEAISIHYVLLVGSAEDERLGQLCCTTIGQGGNGRLGAIKSIKVINLQGRAFEKATH